MPDSLCICDCVVCVCSTCVCGLAQGSAPPRGWHSECIITINEKVNGAFSYISIYIWLSGRTNDVWAVAANATSPKQRGLMCFCGHQMLWIMTHPLNANQMTLDRPRSTVPACKVSCTDTMKEYETGSELLLTKNTFPVCYSFHTYIMYINGEHGHLTLYISFVLFLQFCTVKQLHDV